MRSNTTGQYNTADGINAHYYNTTGYYNAATGGQALEKNTNGIQNTACGLNSLFSNTSGSNNIALGYQAGFNLTTGSNNIVIGAGVLGVAGEANTTRIGKSTQAKTLIGGIYGKGVASATGVAVKIDSTGKLGTILSSARYKEAIKPMDKASEGILALEPVTFRYKQELDPDGVPQFGLVAEQVEKVNPDLVVRDENGKVSTVRYEAVNAMLLNEFLKEHRIVRAQQAKIAELNSKLQVQQKEFQAKLSEQDKAFQSKLAQQQKQMEALTATVQKVSDRIELSQPAPRMAANNR